MTNLRILAYCRRLVRAQESIAKSLQTIAECVQSDWNYKHAPKFRPEAAMTFSSFDPQAASEKWEEEQRIRQGLG